MKKLKPRKQPDRRVCKRRKSVLVEDWRNAWKWLSVQMVGILAALQVAYELLPAAKGYVDPTLWRWLMVAGLVAVIVGRLKAQGGK